MHGSARQHYRAQAENLTTREDSARIRASTKRPRRCCQHPEARPRPNEEVSAMRRLLLLGATLLGLAGTAQANTDVLHVPQYWWHALNQHGFTLGEADLAARSYEHSYGQVRFCQWADKRASFCHVTKTDGNLELGWTDLVTRNGRCPNGSGRHCFTGPLVVTMIGQVGWYIPKRS